MVQNLLCFKGDLVTLELFNPTVVRSLERFGLGVPRDILGLSHELLQALATQLQGQAVHGQELWIFLCGDIWISVIRMYKVV